MPSPNIEDDIYGPCAERMVAASRGNMTPEEARDLLKQMNVVKNQLKASLGTSDSIGLRDRVQEGLRNYLEEDQLKKLQAQYGIVKSQAARNGKLAKIQAMGKTAAQQVKSFIGTLASSWDASIAGRDSTSLKMDDAETRLRAGFQTALEKEGLYKLYNSRALQTEWAHELQQLNMEEGGKPGITGNKDAQKIAQIIHDTAENKVRPMEERSAIFTPKLDGYVSKNTYNPIRMRKAGFEAVRDLALKHLDLDKVFPGLNPEEIENSLKNSYNHFLTGRHFTQDSDSNGVTNSTKRPIGTNLQAKASAQRLWHFKSIEDHMAFNEKFGKTDYTDQVVDSLAQRSRSAVLADEWGLNARENMQHVLDKIKDQAISEGDRKTADFIDNKGPRPSSPQKYISTLLGSGDTYDKNFWTELQQWASMTASASHLGGAAISAQTDVANAANHQNSLFGTNALKNLGTLYPAYLKAMVAGMDADTKRVAQYTGLMGNAFKQLLLEGRYATSQLEGARKTFSKFVFTLNLLHRHDVAVTGVSSTLTAKMLGEMADTPHADLIDQHKQTLDRYGINDKDWDALRQTAWDSQKYGKLLTPFSSDALSNEQLQGHLAEGQKPTQSNFDGIRDKLNQKLNLIFLDQATHTVPAAGLRERTHMFQGNSPNSIEGALLRLAGTYKSFALGMVTKNLSRDMYGNPNPSPGTAALAQGAHVATVVLNHLLMTSILGGAVYAAKQLQAGKKVQIPTNAQQALNLGVHAVSSGGGTGFLGDVFLPSPEGYDKGDQIRDLALGPILGDAAGLGTDAAGMVYGKGSKGERKGYAKDMLRIGLNNVPFQNHFATKYLFNFGVRYPLMEALSPGSVKKMQKRDDGTPFYLPPSMKGSK